MSKILVIVRTILQKMKLKKNKINNKNINLPLDFKGYNNVIFGEYIHIEPQFEALGKGKIIFGNNIIVAKNFTGLTVKGGLKL